MEQQQQNFRNISKETLIEMAKFFQKTSVPRILKKEKEREKGEFKCSIYPNT